jgi:hypothetical protein
MHASCTAWPVARASGIQPWTSAISEPERSKARLLLCKIFLLLLLAVLVQIPVVLVAIVFVLEPLWVVLELRRVGDRQRMQPWENKVRKEGDSNARDMAE